MSYTLENKQEVFGMDLNLLQKRRLSISTLQMYNVQKKKVLLLLE